MVAILEAYGYGRIHNNGTSHGDYSRRRREGKQPPQTELRGSLQSAAQSIAGYRLLSTSVRCQNPGNSRRRLET